MRIKWENVLIRLTALLALMLPLSGYTQDLLDIYQLAIKNDQQFQQATATRQAAAEALPQAMAFLFPNIQFTASSQMNRLGAGDNLGNSAQLSKYNTHGYELTATQPLINFNSWFGVSRAKDSVAQANATYVAASQDLMVRTVTAYFNVLQAADTLHFTEAKKDYLAKQLAQARARFEVGVDAITSVHNAEAAYDSAVAQQITDANALVAAYQNLQTITGAPIKSLKRIMDNLPLPMPNPANLQAWEKNAEEHNLTLQAYRFAEDAARESVKANRANHLPTVSAVGSYEYSRYSSPPSNAINTQKTTQSAIGVQMNLPLFEGGQVVSQTAQAQANFALAAAQKEQYHRQLLANVYQTYSSIVAGISRIEADRQAIVAKNNALESNQAAYQAGTMTIIDVLNAVQNLYDSQRSYTADQYNYLINTLTLKEYAGDLSNLDMIAMNRWLTNNDIIASDQIQVQQKIERPDQILKQVIADNAAAQKTKTDQKKPTKSKEVQA